MSLTTVLRKPVGMSERGKRANNEDSISPLEAQVQDTLFIVCDGVGGAAKGNIASRLVCDTLSKIFQDIKMSDGHFIDTCLLEVDEVMQNYTTANPESTGMATTLTLLHFHGNGATVAHVGDSRIYQIRDGQILYRSEDHSFVQDLVRSGIIRPEEAATHPKRNVITRAIQGKNRPAKADVYVIQDIQPNDYFFLCSDGILESVSDNVLSDILVAAISNEQKIQEIKTLCEARSRDNFSCYLVQVETCNGIVEYAVPQPPARMKTRAVPQVTPEPAAAPPQYSNYKPDAVTVITPPQASKQAESVPSDGGYKPDAVTVITPTQASKSMDKPKEENISTNNRSNNVQADSSPKNNYMFVLYLLFIVAVIGAMVWLIWNNEQ